MAKKIEKSSKKKFREKVGKGVAHIQSTFNNTIVTITNLNGNVLAWSSAGACGFKGAAKKLLLQQNKLQNRLVKHVSVKV